MKHRCKILLLATLVFTFPILCHGQNVRTHKDLQALYDFSESSGSTVKDRAGVGEPLHLKIDDMNAVRRSKGSLEVRGKTSIRSAGSAFRVISAIQKSGEITVEAWVRPANTNQDGPARIVTISKNISERNFTLGQDGDKFDARLRTTRASDNGLPSVSSPNRTVNTKLTHIVYTRDRSGNARIFINGKRSEEGKVPGSCSNWNNSFRLALANELTGDRPWQGTFHLVAIYSRSLSSNEVEQNFRAGVDAPTTPRVANQNDPKLQRTQEGLQVLYDFNESDGSTVKDRSGAGEPIDLSIVNTSAVRRSEGSLEVRGKTVIRSLKTSSRLIAALRKSGEITVEAWVRPANTSQNGPARIVTISKNPNDRNFTLGQERDRYEVRLRTTGTSTNGIPPISSPERSLAAKLTHVVYTRDDAGSARIYINGKRIEEGKVSGEMSNWDDSFRLALANELSGDRPWLGTFYLVAIYSRDLSANEVEQNFKAGANGRATTLVTDQNNQTVPRTDEGLQVLYDFSDSGGSMVKDRSGAGEPINLSITNTSAVRRSEGSLEVRGKTLIRSIKTPSRLIAAIRKSGEITVEAWIRPANTKQDGPARIVTISKDSSERNFTLGQERDRYDVRLRTTGTSTNGMPSISSPGRSLTPKLTHVVYSRNKGGRARIYIDGKRTEEGSVSGSTSNWDDSFRLALANELTGDRPWQGTFYLVAIYNRDLSEKEIEQNFKAGPNARAASLVAAKNERMFHTQIAPILARNCLECHGWKRKRGSLDLSRKDAAFEGGENGKVIIRGKSDESLLWHTVKADLMPRNRPALSERDKNLLKNWIDAGAHWPIEKIDEATFLRPKSNWLRRLTVDEYIETVRAAVGVDIEKDAREILPPDLRADGFSNTAYNLNVDLGHVRAYAKLAQLIVERMDVVKFAGRFSNSKKLSEDNMRKLIAATGKRILRGPLDDHEVAAFLKISDAVAKDDGNFQEAASFILEAMLQSPRFIYRIENQYGDGDVRRVGSYELASRLSYILWGAPPDDELMRAAEHGELSNRNQVEAQVQRMLKDPKAIRHSTRFIDEWLDLGRLTNLQPNSKRFPDWNPELAIDMRDETRTFFKEVVWNQKRPLTDLLNAQVTFLTPRLAKHYGLKPKGNGNEMVRYDLKSIPSRGGLLTQGSLLTVGGDEASTVTRGLFVLHDLLDGHVDDPPPGVDTTPVPTKPGLTQRKVAIGRINNKSCGGCHSKFEPLSFGLEKYDGLGTFHEKDEFGNQLREDGEVLFPGKEKPVSYKTSAEMMNLLAKSDRVERTIIRKMTQWALGRPLVEDDEPMLAKIEQAAKKDGGRYESVITAIVMSDLVLMARTERKQ